MGSLRQVGVGFFIFPNASLFYKEQFLFSCHLFESAFAEFSFGLFTPWVKFAVFRVQSSMFHGQMDQGVTLLIVISIQLIVSSLLFPQVSIPTFSLTGQGRYNLPYFLILKLYLLKRISISYSKNMENGCKNKSRRNLPLFVYNMEVEDCL